MDAALVGAPRSVEDVFAALIQIFETKGGRWAEQLPLGGGENRPGGDPVSSRKKWLETQSMAPA